MVSFDHVLIFFYHLFSGGTCWKLIILRMFGFSHLPIFGLWSAIWFQEMSCFNPTGHRKSQLWAWRPVAPWGFSMLNKPSSWRTQGWPSLGDVGPNWRQITYRTWGGTWWNHHAPISCRLVHTDTHSGRYWNSPSFNFSEGIHMDFQGSHMDFQGWQWTSCQCKRSLRLTTTTLTQVQSTIQTLCRPAAQDSNKLDGLFSNPLRIIKRCYRGSYFFIFSQCVNHLFDTLLMLYGLCHPISMYKSCHVARAMWHGRSAWPRWLRYLCGSPGNLGECAWSWH